MSGPSTRVNLEYLYREPAARAFRSRNVCLCLFLDSRSSKKISEYEKKYRVRIYQNAFALNFLTKRRSIANYCRPTVRQATLLSISIPNSFAFGPFFYHRTCVRSFFRRLNRVIWRNERDVNRINEKRQLRCKDTESKSLLKREVESESDTDGAFFQVDEN